MQLTNIGAAIVSIVVPDKDGQLGDVALGYKNPLDYLGDGPCSGKVPGRYANRIALGKFTLDGVEYTFTKDIELDVKDADSLVYIGIDASHYNEYVSGNYKDSLGNFALLASEYSVRVVTLETS